MERNNDPALSGQIAYTLTRRRGRPENYYLTQILSSLSQASRLRGRGTTGSYLFRDGEVSSLHALEGEGRSKVVSLRFTRSTPSFLDGMVEAGMTEARACTLSCTLKGGINFEGLKRSLEGGKVWSGRSGKTYSSRLRVRGKPVALTAYPGHGVLSFKASWRRGGAVPPSYIIRKLLSMSGEND